VRLDPAYALAQAGLAEALARKYWAPESPATAQYRARALQAAEEALRLDPNLAEAHEALSAIHRSSEAEWDKTIEEGRKALELKATLELPHHHMATAYYHLGLSELSDQESLAGVAANPASRAHALLNRARAALYDGRFPTALQFMWQVDTSDDSGYAWVLAEVQFYLGRHQESERGLQAILARNRTNRAIAERARASLASLMAFSGRHREAEAMLEPLITSPSTDHHVSYRIATTYAQLGRPGAAVQWLQRTAQTGFPCYTWFAKDKLLDPMREDPLFKAFMTEQRAEWQVRRVRYAPVTRAPL
jgi:tetratricopeptide (TPR) repeat protein